LLVFGYRSFAGALETELVDETHLERLYQRTRNGGAEIGALLADLRAHHAKHTKTDRIDSRVLARLPMFHPEGLHEERGLGLGDALRRATRLP
jgi:hypothetical protein